MNFLESAWYRRAGWPLLLWPLSLIFRLFISIRRGLQQAGAQAPEPKVPVIVIGNITLGGTGKTPLLIHLFRYLQQHGYRPGVISRGYGAGSGTFPLMVDSGSSTGVCGDEAVLIAKECGCPVVIDPSRVDALACLLRQTDVDVVLSDDGLQHYKLYRDMEIAVVDGLRQFGNGLCLPAGPLREPVSRLRRVDFLVLNGEVKGTEKHAALADAYTMEVRPRFLVNQVTGKKLPFSGAPFKMGTTLKAVTGIGNPQRFFDLMELLPYPVETFAFPDHHRFSSEDFTALNINERQPVVMTEKDAVKCRVFAGPDFWTLTVDVSLPDEFLKGVTEKLATVRLASPG